MRASLNSYTRRADVERAAKAEKAAAAEAAKYRIELARMKAEADLRSSGDLDKAVNPKLVEMLAEAERVGANEQAEALREVIRNQKQALVNERVAAAEQEVRDVEYAQNFRRSIAAQIPEKYEVWHNEGMQVAQQRIEPVLQQYGAYVDQRMSRGGSGPDLREFFQFLDQHYIRDPNVQAWVNGKREASEKEKLEAARQEGRLAREKELEAERREAAQRHGRRPPTAPSTTQQTGRVAPNGDDPFKDATPGNLRKLAKADMRRRMSEFAGR